MKSARHRKSGSGPAIFPETAPPEPSDFAKKAKDLQAWRDAVVDAASVGGGLWLSYLFGFFYLAIAAGGVSHRDLFFENPVKLPFLNVDLPLLWFFVLGPLLFLIVHAYTLLHFKFLAGKVVAFDAELEEQLKKNDDDTRERLRRQLPSNIFVQFLAGPGENRYYMMGFLLRGIAWISLVIGPVLLLVLFQLQFLPFHNVWISWEQRLIVFADLALLWFLWPAVARRGGTFLPKGHVLRSTVWVCLFVLASLLPVLLVFTVANGEWLEEANSSAPIGWAHRLLVGGEVNQVTRRPRSLWSNRLVLPGIDVIDHAKFDTETKIAALPETVSLRGRNLEGAVLIDAHLRKADFTGAYLRNAVLIRDDLREAKFECAFNGPVKQCADLQRADLLSAQLQGAVLRDAQLQGAVLEAARLQGANLRGAQLQGANLRDAELQGANLRGAQLQGANLRAAQLQGADLRAAQLQGAVLRDAQLQGANLRDAQLQGANLRAAQLQGADLLRAQLQGADLGDAQLQGADLLSAQLQDAYLDHVFVWRTNAKNIAAEGAYILKPDIAAIDPGVFTKLKELVEAAVPQGSQRDQALARIVRLDPDKKSEWQPDDWTRHAQPSPPPKDYEKDYEKALAAKLQEIGCAAEGAPYVIRGFFRKTLRHSSFEDRFISDPAQAAKIVQAFLDEAQCPGARGLSKQDKAELQKIHDRYASAKP